VVCDQLEVRYEASQPGTYLHTPFKPEMTTQQQRRSIDSSGPVMALQCAAPPAPEAADAFGHIEEFLTLAWQPQKSQARASSNARTVMGGGRYGGANAPLASRKTLYAAVFSAYTKSACYACYFP
jgi:hypothetical protein